MRWHIALYSPTRSVWGGSFQYAKAVAEALALLSIPRHMGLAYGIPLMMNGMLLWLGFLLLRT